MHKLQFTQPNPRSPIHVSFISRRVFLVLRVLEKYTYLLEKYTYKYTYFLEKYTYKRMYLLRRIHVSIVRVDMPSFDKSVVTLQYLWLIGSMHNLLNHIFKPCYLNNQDVNSNEVKITFRSGYLIEKGRSDPNHSCTNQEKLCID